MIEQEITLLTNGRISFQKCGNGLQFGYSKNRGVYSIKVRTSGEWNGLTIRAFWHVPDGKDPASSLVVDGYVDVPASVTAQPGSGCVTFEGSDGTKTVTSADLRYRVSANSGTEDGTEPEPGTPAWQELVGTVKKYSDTAVEAKESAKKSADEAKQALEDTKDVKNQAIEEINSVKEDAKGELETLCDSTRDFANQAKEAADRAKASELAAKDSEDKAKTSEIISTANTAEVAKNLETVRDIKSEIDILDANVSANAASSNENANNARISAEAAKQSETNAALSEASALESKNASAENAAKSQNNASNAKNSADSAKESETKAQEYSNLSQSNANASSESASNAKASEDASKKNADDSATTLQELKDGIASGNFKGEKGDKGDPGPQGPQGEPGPDNLVIITATANATVQGEYIPDTTYSNALADIQANKAVMIKLDNVPGRYYIPYSSSNAEILASAGTVSGSNQSIELYLIKWTAQTNTITLTGTREGCIADGGTAGQVLVKKSDDSFDTEWADSFTIITYDGSTVSIDFDTAYNLLHSRLVILINTNRNISFNLNIYSNSIRGLASIGPGVKSLIVATLYWSKDNINFSFNPYYTIPDGGSTGQVLAKKSNAIGDTEWIAPPSIEIPEDYPQIREDVSKLKEDTAALQARQNILIGTETGNPLSVDDAFPAPLCGLTVYGKSTQDGTPTPDAPVPIVSAGDGGSVAVKVTGKNRMPPNLKVNDVVECFVKKNTPITLVFKGDLVSQGGNVLFFDKNNNRNWFGIDKGKAEHHITYPVDLTKFQYLLADMASKNVCLTWNASSPDYEPYREQLLTLPTPTGLPGIPVTSGGNYTDSTGQQWVCDEVDLEKGVKVQRIGNGRVNTSDGSVNEQYRLALDVPGNEGKDGAFPCIISITPYTSWTSCVAGTKLYLKNIAKSEGSFYTAEELKALAIDVDFVYQLVTPIETPLTPAEIAAYKALTAYGPDTVVQASDGAGIKLDYQRDVNIAIKKLEDAIASIT